MPDKEYEAPRRPFKQDTVETRIQKSNGQVTIQSKSSNQSWTDRVDYRRKRWNQTPNFVLLRKSGKLPDHPMYFHRISVTNGPMVAHRDSEDKDYVQHVKVVRSYCPNGGKDYDSSTFPGVPSQLIGRVKFKALARAKSYQFNAPAFIAEAGKTAQMVVDTATKLVMGLRALKHGRVDLFLRNVINVDEDLPHAKKAKRVFNRDFGRTPAKAAANLLLETQYGWIPLINDVRDAALTLQDVVNSDRAQICRVKAKDFESSSSRFDTRLENSPEIWARRTVENRAEARVLWRMSVNKADLPGRFGLLNMAEVAWELTPLSFIGDWFLPIGDYLSALDVPLRFTHHGGTVGTLRRQLLTDVLTHSNYYTSVRGQRTATTVVVERQPLSGPPIPGISEMPFQFSVNAKQAVISIALLRQHLSWLSHV